MKLTAKVKLNPTKAQFDALLDTLKRANEACNFISNSAWENKVFRQYDLHKLIYASARSNSGLAAQVVVRAIAKVADAYKLDRKVKCAFNSIGAIAYDSRILRWMVEKKTVSIWTTSGRHFIPFSAGERQLYYLQFQQGESDLVYHRGKFYLFATCDIPDPTEKDVDDFLGVDLGIVNIATDNDGNIYSGEKVEKTRSRYSRLRAKIQSVGTKSARKKLKKMSGRQSRFQNDTNHVISRRIVDTAERTNRGIALEDLKGIGSRTRAYGKDQRARKSNWAFYQLRQFISYKARMIGVPVILIDPRYTSQRCNKCGHIEKSNRKSQSDFCCVSCGHTDLADLNAAKNISWVAINPPIVSDAQVISCVAPGTSL